jgi:hypothetical protein
VFHRVSGISGKDEEILGPETCKGVVIQ